MTTAANITSSAPPWMVSGIPIDILELVQFIPYHQKEFLVVGQEFVLSLIGTMLSLPILLALVKDRRGLSVDSLFVASFSAADFLFSVQVFLICCVNLATGGWSIGIYGCIVNCSSTIATLGISVMSVLGITGNRYLIFIHNYHISHIQALVMIVSMWVGMVLISAICSILGLNRFGIGLDSTRLYCMLYFYDKNPLSIFAAFIIVGVLVFSVLLTCLSYVQIVVKYLKVKASDDNQEAREKEWLLIKKAILISGSFFVAWLLYILKISYELASGLPAPYIVQYFSTAMGTMHPIFNSLLLLNLDAKIRRSFFEFVGLLEMMRQ